MSLSQPVPVQDPPPRGRRRTYFFLGSAAGLLILLVVGGWVGFRVAGDVQLENALAEADRLDPGWRLPDLEANRAAVPDGENGILQVLAARKLLPGLWPLWPVPEAGDDAAVAQRLRQELDQSFLELDPPVELSARQAAALRAEVRRAEPALARARKLAALPNGRFKVQWAPDFISTTLRHVHEARLVALVLAYDALLRAHEGDYDGALLSCRAALNAGRSIGDEPTLVSQLVRTACRAMALQKAERVLAQGEPPEAALAATQRAFAQEAEEPLLLYALRGERAGLDGFLRAVQTGEISFTQVRGLMKSGAPSRGWSLRPEDAQLVLALGAMRSERARLLHYMNQAVEAAKLPPEEQNPKLARLEAGLRTDRGFFVRLLAPAAFKVAQAVNRTRAELRCGAVALAAERYRRRYGRWPESLTALVPEFLPQVPSDRFDGQPLRLGRFGQGIVVYSVGIDGVDNGGNIVRSNRNQPGEDLGFRLWDVARRRVRPTKE